MCCAAEKFTKKLLGESEIETVLQRLDRLTQDEARVTVAQTLGVVHGLMGNVKVVMEGAQLSDDCFADTCLSTSSVRWEGIYRQYSRRFGYVSHITEVALVLTPGCSHNSPNIK
jgi:hypothetical protein